MSKLTKYSSIFCKIIYLTKKVQKNKTSAEFIFSFNRCPIMILFQFPMDCTSCLSFVFLLFFPISFFFCLPKWFLGLIFHPFRFCLINHWFLIHSSVCWVAYYLTYVFGGPYLPFLDFISLAISSLMKCCFVLLN